MCMGGERPISEPFVFAKAEESGIKQSVSNAGTHSLLVWPLKFMSTISAAGADRQVPTAFAEWSGTEKLHEHSGKGCAER